MVLLPAESVPLAATEVQDRAPVVMEFVPFDTFPTTCNFCDGDTVPTPTLPVALTNKSLTKVFGVPDKE
jgi:hypothetical protein